MSIDEAEWMKANPKIALTFVEQIFGDNDGLTLQEFAKKLLKDNASYKDTAQGSLFDTKPVIAKFKGKIVYATPGSGKTYVAEGRDDIIDGDVVLKEMLVENGWYDGNYNFGQNIYYNRNRIREPFQVRLRALAEEGKTVLTGNQFGLDVADEYILVPDATSIVERTKNRGDRAINKESAQKRVKLEQTIGGSNIMLATELASSQYISDVLFTEEILENPLDDFIGEAFDVDDLEFKLVDSDFEGAVVSKKEWKRVTIILGKIYIITEIE